LRRRRATRSIKRIVRSQHRPKQPLQPFKFDGFSDDVKVAALKVVEIKLDDKPLDDKLFAKP
jgi:hypothetical protein